MKTIQPAPRLFTYQQTNAQSTAAGTITALGLIHDENLPKNPPAFRPVYIQV